MLVNHVFTGDSTWVFQLLLGALWLVGPAVLIATYGQGEAARARSTRLGWLAVCLGGVGFVIGLGWFAAFLDLALGVAAISAARDDSQGFAAPVLPELRRLGATRFAVLFVMMAAISLASIAVPRARHAGTTGVPDRLTVCSRDYRGPAFHYDLKHIEQSGMQPIATAQVMWRNLEIWGETDGFLDQYCGIVVYLRTAPNDFRGYVLLGSP